MKRSMIGIELIIYNKQHRWLEFPLWTSNQEYQDEASLCSSMHTMSWFGGFRNLVHNWRRQVNFKKSKNESSSSKVNALITHNSRTLCLMESCLMIDCQIFILILWACACYNGSKYFLAWFNLITLLLPWPRHRVKSQVLQWIKCYVRNSNT